jgi:multisubunit Na+/H+ antiporter MnhG subunit
VIAREVVVIACLVLATAIVAASAAGIVLMPGSYRKLHYVTPVSVVSQVLVAIAVFTWMGLSENTGETSIAVAFMIVTSPYLSHATLRAIRVRERASSRERRS